MNILLTVAFILYRLGEILSNGRDIVDQALVKQHRCCSKTITAWSPERKKAFTDEMGLINVDFLQKSQTEVSCGKSIDHFTVFMKCHWNMFRIL